MRKPSNPSFFISTLILLTSLFIGFGTIGCGDDDEVDPNGTIIRDGEGDRSTPLGQTCKYNGDCESNACLVRGTDSFGYCTLACNNEEECKTTGFGMCQYVHNASSEYCWK